MEPKTCYLDLKNGPRIAYVEYGDPAGEPVFFCHGWPSSRTMGEVVQEAACELRVRIISPDRPGMSLSEFQSGRTFLDWPPVVTAMAEMLGIGRYRVLGISGGGPYAFASAWANPDAVRAIAVVCGAPPLAGRDSFQGLSPAYAALLRIHAVSPAVIRLFFRLLRRVVLFAPLHHLLKWVLIPLLGPHDRAALKQGRAFEICFESSRDAWVKSAAGPTHDAELYALPWGFAPEEIKIPVRLWHGKADKNFSWTLVETLSKTIPGCTTYFLENEGHYSLPVMHARRILQDLISVG